MPKSDLDHFLQLRIPKTTMATIDHMISTHSELAALNRCSFIRKAVGFALASISAEVDSRGTDTLTSSSSAPPNTTNQILKNRFAHLVQSHGSIFVVGLTDEIQRQMFDGKTLVHSFRSGLMFFDRANHCYRRPSKFFDSGGIQISEPEKFQAEWRIHKSGENWPYPPNDD